MSCTFGFSDLAFGSFDVLAGAQVNTSTPGGFRCTGASPNTTYRFCVNMRQGPDYANNQRNMISGSNLLAFNVYYDANHMHPWGNWPQPYLGGGYQFDATSDGSGNVSGSLTMYGAVPGGQQAAVPGAYLEFMANIQNNSLIYGATPSSGSCQVGSSEYDYAFNVTATVITNCNVSAGALNFGASTLTSGNVDGTATITVQCTNTTPYAIGLNSGSNASGSQRQVRLGATTNYLSYGLYTDSARSQPWGSSASATSCTNGSGTCYLGTGTGSNQSVTVYGRVPPQAAPAAGTYSDSVILTVTY